MVVGSSLFGAAIAAQIFPPSPPLHPVQVQNDVNPFCNNLIFHLFAANSCFTLSELFPCLFGGDWGAEIVPARPRWLRCLLGKHNFRARFIASVVVHEDNGSVAPLAGSSEIHMYRHTLCHCASTNSKRIISISTVSVQSSNITRADMLLYWYESRKTLVEAIYFSVR